MISKIMSFPRAMQRVISATRTANPLAIEVTFAAPPTDAELIDLWLRVKTIPPRTDRPVGWEPTDKSNLDAWEAAE